MELKVWVDNPHSNPIQRIVCGVTEKTTCQDVVFALAHAIGKIGRFTLIERWRNNERLLAPNDNPLKILMKWGEYSNDVQFILQRSDQQQINAQQVQKQKITQSPPPQTHQSQQQIARQQQQQQTTTTTINANENEISSQQQQGIKVITTTSVTIDNNSPLQIDKTTRDIRKSINLGTNNEIKNPDNIGVVKGVPQKSNNNKTQQQQQQQHQYDLNHSNVSLSSTSSSITPDYAYVTKTRITTGEFNSADIRNSLDKKINLYKDTNNINRTNTLTTTLTATTTSNDNILMDTINQNNNNNNNTSETKINIIPNVSSNGALLPPPYRDPPPPRNSPSSQKSSPSDMKKYELKDMGNMNIIANINDINELNEVLLNNAHYKDLIQLIKYQREKINLQQADLTKYDAEIVYLENRERDQMQQLEAISREFNKTDQIFRQGNEQLQTLQYVEEENELVRQQEKTLKSEITLLRSKLANCETELLQCKNKVRLLLDDIQIEQRSLHRQYDNRQQIERHFLIEVEKIQSEIEQAIHTADTSNKTTDNLKREVATIENAIAEKKKQVEQLVNEMKEVNLQSLAIAPSEEIRNLLEGSNHRPGSTRRMMIGSPRQLENAVPTSKNPHGVWV